MFELGVDLSHCALDRAEREQRGAELRAALERLDASPHAGFLRVLERRALLAEIEAFVRARRGSVRDVVQLGIGGSSLGAQALCRALLPARHNESARPPLPRVHFPDNVDPESFAALLDALDPRRTLVHVVSKSGDTLETQAQLHALLAAFVRRTPRMRLRERLVVTTGEKGELREFAEREGIPILGFPADVPGRYSVFTASGLLVPALAGVPIRRVLAGARRMLEHCRRDPLVGPAGELALVHAVHDLERRRPIHVELIYADALLLLGDWFRQIWAESLGKQGRGPTPVVARGTTDQHSQLQLYLEGPDDKLYTVVRAGRLRRRLRLPRGARPPEIAARDLAEVFDAEAAGTVEALQAVGRPLVLLQLPAVRAELVGELLLMQQLQTALAGALYACDPFTQPGVQLGKDAALRLLAAGRRSRSPRAGSARRGTRRG